MSRHNLKCFLIIRKKELGILIKLLFPPWKALVFFELNELIHLDADSNYTLLYFTENRKILASKTLKEFEDQLGKEQFIRLHNSHLVNIRYISRYIKGEGGR